MGNLCGKEEMSAADPFARPGRTLSSAAAAPPRPASPPVARGVGGPRGAGSVARLGGPADRADAQRNAAVAAEERARAAQKTTGRLGSQLQEQKKQTRAEALAAASRDERRMRDVDDAAKARAYG